MNVAKITHKKIIDKKKNKVVDFGLLNTLKYIKLKIDTLVDIKPTNVSIFITLI